MMVLITYDVSTADRAGEKRLRRVARACLDYGVRVQKSVFECTVGDKEWATLRGRLLAEMDLVHDSVRIYFLDTASLSRREHHGAKKPPDLSAPLIA
jgi:CRISPR-associated protein Cas2